MAAHSPWGTLPSLIIIDILSYLSLTDRVSCTSTCRRWRSCLFHPTMWRRIWFRVRRGGRRRTRHLADMCGRFVRQTDIEFNGRREEDVRECLRVLNILSTNVKLERLVLRPESCQIAWPVCEATNTVDLYLDALEGVIRTARGLRHLSLGCVGELTDYSASLVSLLAIHQSHSLQKLQIASIKEDPELYGLIDLPSGIFATFRNLTVLGLDYDYLTVELLNGFAQNNRAKMERLIIHVHGIEPDRPSIPNSAWRAAVMYNPRLEVTLNLIHSVDGATGLLNLLRPALPLAHLRMFFCGYVNVAAMNFIAEHYYDTLCSVHIVDGMDGLRCNSYSADTDEDPFVMMAWQCSNLSSFTLIGYEMCNEDAVAIARLRGPQLTTFAVPACCIFAIEEDEDNNMWIAFGTVAEEFNAEVSQGLGRKWEPLTENDLHPAVTDPRADAETAYLQLLLEDQA